MLKFFATKPLAAAVIIALAATACAGDDSAGLATLVNDTTTTVGDTYSAAGTDGPSDGSESTTVPDTSDSSETTEIADADAAADLTDEERLLEFAACMRDNSVDFPDPVVEADGTIAFGRRPGQGGGGQSGDNLENIGRDPDLPAARTACQPLIEGLALGPGGQNFDELQVERADQLLAFAQCMRDNGVDVGDPDVSAFGPGGGGDGPGNRPFGELDFDDPQVSNADEICGQQVTLPGRGARGGAAQ